MELVGQYRKPSTRSVVSIQFPWLVWIALSLLTSITIVVIGVVMAAHREVSDPFSAFSDLFGGGARQAALARGFTCNNMESRSHPQALSGYCAQRNTDEMFSGIFLRMSGNIANELNFSLRENSLTLGDLVLLWGEPEIWQACAAVVITWPAHHIQGLTVFDPNGQISYFLPIRAVSFMRSGSPQWGRVLMNDALHNCG